LQKIKQEKVSKLTILSNSAEKFDPFVTVSGSDTLKFKEDYIKITSA